VPEWRPTPRQVLWAIRIAIVLGVLIAIGHSYGITLWDWIKLLIVPAVIAGGGLWFNAQQRERERQIANERAQDEALQGYLDGMSELLTDKEQPLHKAQPGDNLSTVARAQTLIVLSRLEDGGRKRSVLEFLYESHLIDQIQAKLDKSNLIERRRPIVILAKADLSGANLHSAYLRGAHLRGANLRGAYLRGAYLREAYLRWADLKGARGWTKERLREANSLDGATMPDGQILKDADGPDGPTFEDEPDGPTFEEWLKSKGRGEDGK
jgi:uncharacterized protein YjbI with pentapeptide repeats